MKRIAITKQFSMSQIAHGYWRAAEWNYSTEDYYALITELIALGITTFDHANIYGNGEAEAQFGKVLKAHPELREQIELVSKCGIVKNPNDKTGLAPSYYDTTYNHIVESVNASLKRLETDYLDVLLIHRVDHLMDYEEVGRAFSNLRRAGKVRYFGVSNFLVPQLLAIKKAYPEVVINQIQVSVDHLEHYQNGVMEKLSEAKMKAMAYSPVGGAKLLTDPTYKPELRACLERIRDDLQVETIEHVMYAWIMKHPLQIIPIVGSSKLERIKIAVEATDINLTNQQFYEIFAHSQMKTLP